MHDEAVSPARLVALRNQLGLTQAQAARAFGVGTTSWARWERGQTGINPGCAFAIRLILDRAARARHMSTLADLRNELLAGAHARTRSPHEARVEPPPPQAVDRHLKATILELLEAWQVINATSLLTLIRSKQPYARSDDIEAALASLQETGAIEVEHDPLRHRPRYSLTATSRTCGVQHMFG